MFIRLIQFLHLLFSLTSQYRHFLLCLNHLFPTLALYKLVYNFFLPILFSHRNFITLFLVFSYPYFSHPHPISSCLDLFPIILLFSTTPYHTSSTHLFSHRHPTHVFSFHQLYFIHTYTIPLPVFFYYFQLIFFSPTLYTLVFNISTIIFLSFLIYHYYFSTYNIG